MISFFSKNTYLVDMLDGFIDIHNHLLPGIDDGAQSVEESINLIKGLAEFGIQNFIATPHIMYNYHDNDSKTIGNALILLQNRLSALQMNAIEFSAGAEHMIDSNFEKILENDLIMPLGKNHLLVEMSYLQPPLNFDEAIKAVTSKWLFPVLAHPERYGFLHNRFKKYDQFKTQNILFQLNLLSLGGYYGQEVNKMGIKLLEKGMIDFIGSDVHNIAQLNELKKVVLSKKILKLIKPIIENTIETFK